MPKIKKYFEDIIACVKFEDYYCFFSFRELYENNSFNDTRFIYNNKQNVLPSRKIRNSLSKNEFIGLSSDNIILKKSLYDFFQFQYYEPEINREVFKGSSNYRRTITGLFRYLNGKDYSLGNTNFLDDKNFKISSHYGNPKNIYFMRVLENSFILPDDVKDFALKAASISGKNFSDFNLKSYDLPRIVDYNLLNIIFSQLGARQMASGQMCYNIIYHKDTLYLEKNMTVDEENVIQEINQNNFEESFFDFNRGCYLEDFRIGDNILGILYDGVFIPFSRDMLLKEDSQQKNYFRIHLENYDNKSLLKKTIFSIRKYFGYPKKTLYLLSSRPRYDYPYEERTYDYTTFTQAFYNLVTFYKPVRKTGNNKISLYGAVSNSGVLEELTNFRLEVIEEFLDYINNNYIRTGFFQDKFFPNRNAIIENLKIIRDKISIGEKIVTRQGNINKDIFSYVIKGLTGIPDEDEALLEFFSSPSIIYGDYEDRIYPYLRSISFFVTCDKENACDNLITASDSDTENITFPVLIDQRLDTFAKSFSIYYNTRLLTYVNYPL